LNPPAGRSRVAWLRPAFDESSLKVETLTAALPAAKAWEQEAKLTAAAMVQSGCGGRTRGGPWCGAQPVSATWRREILLVGECRSSAALRALARSLPSVRWHFSRQPVDGRKLGWLVAAMQSPARSGRSGRSGRPGRSGKSNWVGHPKRREYQRRRPPTAANPRQLSRKKPAAATGRCLPSRLGLGRSGCSGRSNWAGHQKRREYSCKRPAASGAERRQQRKHSRVDSVP
jgi:hypothetical protein